MPDDKDQTPIKVLNKIVLMVEDDPVLIRMYSEKFNYEGLGVIAARDGQEALQLAQKEKIDFILLDIMLPRMSGTDFLERFRETEKGKNVPVLVLTNLTEQGERDRAIKLGVKEYLVKAMHTPDQVVQKIKDYLK